MTNFAIRTVTYSNQIDTSGIQHPVRVAKVELLIIGNPKFNSRVRSRFFSLTHGDGNGFDNCIVYLGRLNQGKWITDADYETATQLVYKSWRKYDSETIDVGPKLLVSPLDRNQGVDLESLGNCIENGVRTAIARYANLANEFMMGEKGVDYNVVDNLNSQQEIIVRDETMKAMMEIGASVKTIVEGHAKAKVMRLNQVLGDHIPE